MTLLITTIFIWNTKSLITGEIKTLFVNYDVPHEYLVLQKHMANESEYYRTLWTPTYSRWSFYSYNHPKISILNIINADWNYFIKNNENNLTTPAELSMEMFISGYSVNLFNNTSTKYVIVPLADRDSNDDFFHYFGKHRQYYINELEKIPYLKKINIGTKELVVYENEGYRPHIYTTGERETIYKEVPYKVVDFRFINPTEYKISLKNISTLTYINFSEAFHQDWRVRMGEFNWFKVLTEKNYFIPNKYHYKNDAQLNSFLIDPNVICRDYECKKNPDGSYDLNLTLFFSPQSYLYLGLIISGLTLFGCLSYLVIYFVRSRKTKHPKHPKPLPQASTS